MILDGPARRSIRLSKQSMVLIGAHMRIETPWERGKKLDNPYHEKTRPQNQIALLKY
ncbi:Uncharacterized protein APZ42_027322 [Daphnia magna]|uniref:Uncharacterized protein n=1 Tax=Daphnia magna TaxID=35525 RepID=A0A164RG52_9CRUS|nr:Uncharacterized protein APZ42_027322 [Daphnia magna]